MAGKNSDRSGTGTGLRAFQQGPQGGVSRSICAARPIFTANTEVQRPLLLLILASVSSVSSLSPSCHSRGLLHPLCTSSCMLLWLNIRVVDIPHRQVAYSIVEE